MSRKSSVQYGSLDVLILQDIPGDGVTLARGAAVPADATAGYAKGCIFMDTDGAAGAVQYVNEGSNTSCDFNLAVADGQAFLSGVTAGTATASKAVVLGASKEIATITTLTATTVNASAVVIGQGTPTAKTGVTTIAIADILTGIVTLAHTVGSTVALTLDTGTAMDTGKPASLVADQAIDWYLINTSAAALDTGTLTAAGGHTIVGNAIIQSAHVSTGGIYGNSAHFRSRRTATNTWITYRVG